MDSVHPEILVKMLQEATRKTSKTKYFIRVGDPSDLPETDQPINLPGGGFLVNLPTDMGSSDFIRPQ